LKGDSEIGENRIFEPFLVYIPRPYKAGDIVISAKICFPLRY